jgi:hypothetical protein
LHVCTPLPEHRTAPGTHTPVQTPETHAELVQADAVPHCPVDEQVCTPLLEHCVELGMHTPVQAPLAQANVQAEAFAHWPVALQV